MAGEDSKKGRGYFESASSLFSCFSGGTFSPDVEADVIISEGFILGLGVLLPLFLLS
jgi:hypothetical protein